MSICQGELTSSGWDEEVRKATERATERIMLLQRTTAALSRALTRAEVVGVTLRESCAILGAEAGVVALRSGDVLEMTHRDLDLDGCPDSISIADTHPLAVVARTGQPAWFSSAGELAAVYPGRCELALRERLKAGMVLPLLAQGRSIGAIGLGFAQERDFSSQDHDFALTLVRQCAQALDRARLFDALSLERRQLQAVLQQMPAGVIIVEAPSGTPIFGNAKSEQLFGAPYVPVQADGETGQWKRLRLDGTPYTPDRLPIARALVHGEEVTGEEMLFRHGDGREVVLSVNAAPIQNERGKTVYGVVAFADVTGRRRAEQQLAVLLKSERTARTEAEAANRMKDDFLARVSHELATPLFAIRMWISALRDGNRSVQGKAVDAIEQCAQQLSSLIEDLLDAARAACGKLRLLHEPVDLRSVAEAAIEALRPPAEANTLTIETAFEEGPCQVMGDAARLQQVVSNLLSNAIKFTPPGGKIEVRLARRGEEIELRVSDTGQGISAEFLPELFLPFHQADDTSTRVHGGLGLGLSIVRQLVGMHHGSVRAESQGPGKGATFTILLPASPSSAQGLSFPGEPAAGPTGVSLRGLYILVVDDDDQSRTSLALLLECHGARVTTTASAGQALEVLRHEAPDVLLCDIAMPYEDGYSLIRKVRAMQSKAGKIPAAALTAHARAGDRARALAEGFQAHIAKPVDPRSLLEVVRSLLAHAPGAQQPG